MKGPITMIKPFAAVLLAFFSPVLSADDTVGFYRFRDKGFGESAVGVTIVNSADAATHAGTVTATEGGTVKFSDDVPGRYFFELDSSDQQPYAENLGSLCFSGSEQLRGKSGNVAFEKINEMLSGSEDAEYTIEFFFKPENYYGAEVSILNFDDGRYDSDDTVGQLTAVNLWYPMTAAKKSLRMGEGMSQPSLFVLWTQGESSPSLFGSWHHMALVVKDGKFGWYLDYTQRVIYNNSVLWNTMPWKGKAEGPVKFGCDNFQGKLCAFRVSSSALGPGQFLRATDYPRGKALTHLSFEEFEPGTALKEDSIGNIAMHRCDEHTGKGDGKAGGDGVFPIVADKVFRTWTCDGGDLITRNFRSARLSVCTNTTSPNFLSGPSIEIPASRLRVFNESFTMEGYFKYDPDGVLEKIGALSNPRYRMHLLGMNQSNSWVSYAWLLYYDLEKDELCLTADLEWVSSEGQTKHTTPIATSEEYVGGLWKGGARRHLAVTCDMKADGGVEFIAYCDGVRAVSMDISDMSQPKDEAGATAPWSGPRLNLSTEANVRWAIGTGVNASPFNGWVDDIRITEGVLPASSFLYQENRYGTVMSLR